MSEDDDFKKRKDTDSGSPLRRQHSGDAGGLLVEPDGEDNQFAARLEQTLSMTEQELLQKVDVSASAGRAKSWERARLIVQEFQPVPWFIWRLSNYVLGRPGKVKDIPEGLIFGLRRLLFAAASDPVLGEGEKISDVRRALRSVPADVIAAAAVVHAICRRLGNKAFDRIWRPILDDALLRARIGHMVGMLDPFFGIGRGMLAGFSGRSGLTVLIAMGTLEQAREALDLLAAGAEIGEVGLRIYSCEPLQVSAMLLSAAGCGRDAAFGTASFSLSAPPSEQTVEERKWLAAFAICEAVRKLKAEEIPEDYWELLGFRDAVRRLKLIEEARKTIRRGHEWNWLLS